jgi:hypothetical protein
MESSNCAFRTFFSACDHPMYQSPTLIALRIVSAISAEGQNASATGIART